MKNKIIEFDENKPLLFLGDNHGQWKVLFEILKDKKISHVNLIHLGDDGIGFLNNPEEEIQLCQSLNQKFQDLDINFYSLRGNHCDPKYFQEENQICLPHFHLLQDYTVGKWGKKTLQFIGGAISIDRMGRIPNKSYWKTEGIHFHPKKCQKVDILVTHTTPAWCYPQEIGTIVRDWAQIDKTLIKDLLEERDKIGTLFELCQPQFHYYGHMHSSWTATIGGCKHKLLDINELFEHISPEISVFHSNQTDPHKVK